MHNLSSCRLATLSLLLLSFYIGVVHSSDTQVNQCQLTRPKSSKSCEGESVRRYFLSPTNPRGCKPFGICPDNAATLDTNEALNYFPNWTACQQTCMAAIECPPVEQIANGSITTDEFFGWGSKIFYSCHEGFSLVGTKTRTCQKNKTWTGDAAPYCQAQCKQPPQVANALIAPVLDYYDVNTIIHYTCDDGFNGDTQRMCMSNGEWSGPEPFCDQMAHVQCPEPNPIDYGHLNAVDRSVGANLTYSCDAGFILIGNSTRKCGEDEMWEGEEPICWKLEIEEQIDGNEQRVITNRTISLPEGRRGVRINIISTDNSYLTTAGVSWCLKSFNGENKIWPEGVLRHDTHLSFTAILGDGQQEGTYTLRVGDYSVHFNLTVAGQVEIPRNVSIRPLSVFVPISESSINVGEPIILTCVFTACPQATATWFHKGVPIQNGERPRVSVHSIQDNHITTLCILQINPASTDDTGDYQCVGGNGIESLSSQMRLNVLPMPTDNTTRMDNTTTVSQTKRSVENERSPLCSSTNTEPTSVTVVGRVQRNIRRRKSPYVTLYQLRVNRVIGGDGRSIPRDKNIRAVIVDANAEYPQRIKRNSDYILKGNIVEDTLVISGYDSIRSHSNELESSLLQC